MAGSSKGHVVIYNDYEKRKQMYAGIHSKAVTDGVWGPNGLVAMGGHDNLISLTRASDGLVVSQVSTPKWPSALKVRAMAGREALGSWTSTGEGLSHFSRFPGRPSFPPGPFDARSAWAFQPAKGRNAVPSF